MYLSIYLRSLYLVLLPFQASSSYYTLSVPCCGNLELCVLMKRSIPPDICQTHSFPHTISPSHSVFFFHPLHTISPTLSLSHFHLHPPSFVLLTIHISSPSHQAWTYYYSPPVIWRVLPLRVWEWGVLWEHAFVFFWLGLYGCGVCERESTWGEREKVEWLNLSQSERKCWTRTGDQEELFLVINTWIYNLEALHHSFFR